MDRRKAIQHLGLLTTGLFLMPSCKFSEEKASIALSNLEVTSAQEAFLKEVCNTIIPEDDFPGATTLEIQHFVWIMIDECTSKKEQLRFINGLTNLKTKIQSNEDSLFKNLSSDQKFKVLESSFNNEQNDEITFFLNTTKRYCIKGFLESKYIMTEVMPYELIPGTFGLCESVDPNKRINIHG